MQIDTGYTVQRDARFPKPNSSPYPQAPQQMIRGQQPSLLRPMHMGNNIHQIPMQPLSPQSAVIRSNTPLQVSIPQGEFANQPVYRHSNPVPMSHQFSESIPKSQQVVRQNYHMGPEIHRNQNSQSTSPIIHQVQSPINGQKVNFIFPVYPRTVVVEGQRSYQQGGQVVTTQKQVVHVQRNQEQRSQDQGQFRQENRDEQHNHQPHQDEHYEEGEYMPNQHQHKNQHEHYHQEGGNEGQQYHEGYQEGQGYPEGYQEGYPEGYQVQYPEGYQVQYPQGQPPQQMQYPEGYQPNGHYPEGYQNHMHYHQGNMQEYEGEGEYDGRVWEERFYEIYSKFEIFVEKFEVIFEQIYIIEEQFETVSTEDEWNELRSGYTELINKFNQIRDEIIDVLENTREVPSKERGDNTGKSTDDKNLWEHRYYEILQQHDALAQEYSELKKETDFKKRSSVNDRQEPESEDNEKIEELQNALNSFHQEYKELEESYNKLSEAYSNAIAEIQHLRSEDDGQQPSEEKMELEAHLRDAEERIQYMEQELAKKIQMEKWNVEGGNTEMLNQYAQQIEMLENEKNELINSCNEMQEELEKYDAELGRSQQIIDQQNQNIESLQQQYNILQQKLQNLGEPQQRLQQTIDMLELREKQNEALRNELGSREMDINTLNHHREVLAAENKQVMDKIEEYERIINDQNYTLERYKERVGSLEMEVNRNNTENSQFHEQIEENIAATHEKNRKIKFLEEEIKDLESRHERKMNEKNSIISELKSYAEEQEDKFQKKIKEKEHNFIIVKEKIKSLENELANRNLEISRFRPQVTSSNTEEIRQLNDIIDKKNTEIQQLRREKENKKIQLWEQEQNYDALQIELNNKTFELNNIKRELYDLHNYQAQIDSLNNMVKKKNQEINQLRLSGIQKDQLQNTIENLKREKVRINENLKEKTRECENKDNTIKNLQNKVALFSAGNENVSVMSKYTTVSKIENNEILSKHKESEVKKLKYELELCESVKVKQEKTIKDLNRKIEIHQKTFNTLKFDIDNKVNNYEQEVKNLTKEIKELKKDKYENTTLIETQKVKISSLEKSQKEGLALFDKEIHSYKQKQNYVEHANTQLSIELELTKNDLVQTGKENRELKARVEQLQEKIDGKNKQIEELKVQHSQKQIDGVKEYQRKISELDGELKLSGVKIRNMEDEIGILNKKIKNVETEKDKYKGRLYTETSGGRDEYVDMRQFSEYNEILGNSEVNVKPRFKLKDAEANDVFQRKVIYELKRENDYLRKELSGVGLSHISIHRLENQYNSQMTQQEINLPTDPNYMEQNHDMAGYYKDKNKELEALNSELLRVNKELKAKVQALGSQSNSKLSIQYYKDEIANLQNESAQLQAKVKKLVSENQTLKDKYEETVREYEEYKVKYTFDIEKINENSRAVKGYEIAIEEKEHAIRMLSQDVEALKEEVEGERKEKDRLVQASRSLEEEKRRTKELEQEIGKLSNKIAFLQKEIEQVRSAQDENEDEADRKILEIKAENKKLKVRITELEDLASSQGAATLPPDMAYRMELFRSYCLLVESLIGEVEVRGERDAAVLGSIRESTASILQTVSSISIA